MRPCPNSGLMRLMSPHLDPWVPPGWPDTETPSDVIRDDPMTGMWHDALDTSQHWGPGDAAGMHQKMHPSKTAGFEGPREWEMGREMKNAEKC